MRCEASFHQCHHDGFLGVEAVFGLIKNDTSLLL
jgi:hypothetical protein